MSANLAIVLPGHSPLGNRRPVPAAFLLPSHMTCSACGVEHDIEALEVTDDGYRCTPCVAASEAEVDYVRALRWRALTGPVLLLSVMTSIASTLVSSVLWGTTWMTAPGVIGGIGYGIVGVGGLIVVAASIQSALRARRLARGPIAASAGLMRAGQVSDALVGISGLMCTGLAVAGLIVGLVL